MNKASSRKISKLISLQVIKEEVKAALVADKTQDIMGAITIRIIIKTRVNITDPGPLLTANLLPRVEDTDNRHQIHLMVSSLM